MSEDLPRRSTFGHPERRVPETLDRRDGLTNVRGSERVERERPHAHAPETRPHPVVLSSHRSEPYRRSAVGLGRWMPGR